MRQRVALAQLPLGSTVAAADAIPNGRLARPRGQEFNPVLAESDSGTRARAMQSYLTRPLMFEANQGQTEKTVRYLSRGIGYELFLTGNEAVLALGRTSQNASVKGQVANGKKQKANHPKLVTAHSSLVTSFVKMRLQGANPAAKVTGIEELPGKTNYFIGNNSREWRTNIPTYAKVKYESVYPGVDLIYYGNQRQLEYDFVLAPGAELGSIRLAIGGLNKSEARHVLSEANANQKSEGRKGTQRSRIQKLKSKIDSKGDLVIQTGSGEIRFHKPVAYQEQLATDSSKLRVEDENRNLKFEHRSSSPGTRHFFDGRYVLRGKRGVGFEVASYDRAKPLIIDPVLSYSTFLGGNKDDVGNAIAVDGSGNAYVTGSTLSPNFPTSLSPFESVCRGCASNNTNAFVTKFNPAGSALVYSTYLGGNNVDSASAIAVDSSGNVFLTGSALSINFPTMNAFQTTCGSCLFGSPDAFVTELNAAGSALVYSTYLGGSRSDQGAGIAVDSTGNAYVTGTTLSNDFPTSIITFQNTCQGCASGASDAFVAKFDPTGATLVYSTFLGGSGTDQGLSIAVDSGFNAYVAGRTQSNNFPTANAFQPTFGGNQDGFVTKFSATGSPVYSTYLGGGGNDDSRSIALDSAGNAYVTGFTNSTNFPTANAIQASLAGNQDAYVLKLDRTGSTLDYSTYLGGSNTDGGTGIAVDSADNAYVTGVTASRDFPTANPIQAANAGNQDAFVTKISSTGAAIIFSTYLGGHDVDTGLGIAVESSASPNAYVTGSTFSNDFPTANAFQPATGGGFDAFVTKLSGLTAPAITLSSTSLTFSSQPVGTSSPTQSVTLTDNGDATLTIASTVATGDFSESDTCDGSVAAGANCSITVTFTPMATGPRAGAITITDNASGSPQTIRLTGTGTAPATALSPTSLNFSSQGVATTSLAQTITLSNSGTAPLNIAGVSISSGFTQTNTCGSSVASGSSCTFSVTFSPSTVGPASGSLTVTDNATGSPQNIPLAGSGVVAFSLSAALTSQTVNKGTDSTTFTVSAASQFGFARPISLACANNAPTNCTFNPTSIVPGQSSTLTVTNLTALGTPTLNFNVIGTSGSQSATQPLSVLIPDFQLIVAPPSQTVNAGQSTTFTVSLTPINNFSELINLTCTGAPASSTCAINPNVVTLSGGSATTIATVTVTTTMRAAIVPGAGPRRIAPRLNSLLMPGWLTWLLAFAMLTLMATAARRRRAPLGFVMTALFVLLWAACSVGSKTSNGTPAGTYALQIKAATTGTVQHTANASVTVN